MKAMVAAISLRRIVFALSMACLIAAAGMMLAFLAQQIRATARRNAEKEATGQDVAREAGQIERDGPMTIRSQRQSAEHGMRFYDGDVQIDLPPLGLQCQHVAARGPRGRVRPSVWPVTAAW